MAAALALLFELVVLGGPAAAQRQSPGAPAAARPGRAYVTDITTSTVTVVDTATFEIVAVIPVGFFSLEATASPDGSVVYVSAVGESSIHVIDTATNTVTTTIAVGESPQGVVFTPDSATAYVANNGSHSVSVIDTATNTVTVPLEEGAFPTEVAVSPDGTHVYVVNSGLGSVSVIDTATDTVIATIPVGESPSGVVVSPNNSRAYVTNTASGTVSVINTATNTVIATIPVDPGPTSIGIAPDGSEVYVGHNDVNTLSVIDPASNTVTDRVAVTGVSGPMNIVVTARRVYVAYLSGHLVVFDRVIDQVIAIVDITDPNSPFSATAWGLAVIETDTPPTATPTITTQASPSNLLGGTFTDTATLTGGLNPTGQVVFRLYSDSNCLNQVNAPTTAPLVNGTATAQMQIGVAGTYYWRAVYTGDANNNPATHPCNAPNESVVVRPFAPPPFTETITGDFVGPVIVDAGESVQIIDARVVGPVTVNPGGSLVVVISEISRGIVATRPGFLSICGTDVSGPAPGQALGVFDADVPIRVGAVRNGGCAGNRFAGSVNLIGNEGVQFSNNIVSHNVTVNDSGPRPTEIESNTIFGNLACAGNNPPPTPNRPLVRNIVRGTRSGQCAGAF